MILEFVSFSQLSLCCPPVPKWDIRIAKKIAIVRWNRWIRDVSWVRIHMLSQDGGKPVLQAGKTESMSTAEAEKIC